MEGHITLSRKEQKQHALYPLVQGKVITLKEAGRKLGISYRQAKRNYKRYLEEGAFGLVHRLRGRPSNHRIPAHYRETILEYYRERLQGFNLQHASEKLLEQNLPIHPETLRLWLKQAGEWVPRRKKVNRHRSRRERKAQFGEMLQMDGSFHEWIGTGEKHCMMVLIDDATNIISARLYKEETTKAAMEMLKDWIQTHGIPESIYTDRKSVYKTDREPTIEEQLKDIQPKTAFGKVCDKLGIRLITAHSPQAKGRVERENGTLQDRAVSELRYHGIDNIEDANQFLATTFLPNLNRKFRKTPASETDGHRKTDNLDINAIFSWEDTRKVNNDWTIRFQNQYYQLNGPTACLPPAKQRVIVQKRLDGSIHILYRGRELSYKAISKPPASRNSSQEAKHTTPWLGLGHKPAATHPWRQ